jgi:PhoPQ-activated pathogenicity-related protein
MLPCLLAITALTAACAAQGGGGLREYVKQPQPQFGWSKQGESTVGDIKIVTLRMRSQVWREIPWDHAIQVFLPAKAEFPRTALLFVTGGNPGPTETFLGATLVQRIKAPAAILYNIPNQPLLGGKLEDDLIAHTFSEYLESGDGTWPLLFPMTNSAVRAMDALQAFSREGMEAPIDGFVVTGASKRGWTTWLTAAVDTRVRGIAPMVFDNLNFERQMPRQLELWNRYSEQIEDYTRRGLQQKMSTERGKRLVSMVDPWFYRKELKLPKLLINGANDRYWATDATRIYWDDLEGEKHLLSIPNAGHGLDDRNRLLNTLAAFFRSVAAGRPLPRLTAAQANSGGSVRLEVRSTMPPKEVRIWTARAAGLDFRPVRWQSAPAKANGDASHEAEVPAPKDGPERGLAVFAEAEYEVDGQRFTLSTPSVVYGSNGK